MSYASLMANVELGQSNRCLLQVTGDIAARFDSELLGASAYQPLRMLYGEGILSPAPFEQDRENIELQMRDAEVGFRQALESTDSALSWRSTTAFALPTDWLAREARAADLLIASVPTDPYPDAARRVDLGSLVMQAGRPLLLVPEGIEQLALTQVVVGWSDTREARRAIRDALPLLKQATQVIVVEVAVDESLDSARHHVEDVARWLKAHGVAAKTFELTPSGVDAVQLRRFAEDHQADLIVAGAYGHSRLLEWAFGGVTRDLLLRADCCALLSH